MDTATIFTTLKCNQGCTFCTFRRREDDPVQAQPQRVLADISAAVGQGATTLVISGGEPTLDARLPDYVAAARGGGIDRVVVETNGLLLAYPGRAEALRDSGVSTVRVAIPGVHDAYERITRSPGTFRHAVQGMKRCHAAGIALEVSVPLTVASLEGAAAVPGWAAALGVGVHGLVLRVVTQAAEGEAAPFAEVAPVAEAMALECREHDLTCRFDPRHAVPLCFFGARRRFAELFVAGPPLQGHGFERIAGCDGCAADTLCPGVPAAYLETHGDAGSKPLGEKDTRLVKGLGGARATLVERELVTDGWSPAGDALGVERVVRVVFHCNQDCAFCFVNRDLPAVGFERITEEIERAAQDGVTLLSLSGGEPTLNARLTEHVRHAAGLGLRVRLQTNAIRCARTGYATALAEAGVAEAFVSLHGSTAEISDAVTAAPGTFEQTLEGIGALLAANIPVILNTVVTGHNHADLPSLIRLILARWGTAPTLNLSYAHASTDLVPVSQAITPRFSDVRPSLATAIALAKEAGLVVRGFDGMCGLPLCFLDAGWMDLDGLAPVPGPNPPAGFLKPATCSDCALWGRCVGVRETYAHLHGLDELRPHVGAPLPSGRLVLPGPGDDAAAQVWRNARLVALKRLLATHPEFEEAARRTPVAVLNAVGAPDVLPWLLGAQSGATSGIGPAMAAVSAPATGEQGRRLANGGHLARVDNNPLAEVEAHPDKQGNALDLGGRTEQEWVRALNGALDLIGDALPALRSELDLTLARVVPVGCDDEVHLSASYREAPGTVYMTLHPDPVTMAAALVHETQHGKLNALTWTDPVLRNGHDVWTESPVRPDLRPLMGVLLAVHAFAPVGALMRRLKDMGHSVAADPGFDRRLAEVLEANARCLDTLREKADPTPVGAALLRDLESLHSWCCR